MADVLVMRSCREAPFAAAVQLARARTPGARIAGLTVAGHRETVLRGGVDEAIEVPGPTFHVLRLMRRGLRPLRARRFDEVVIPQMTPDVVEHFNVYAAAAALRADRYVILHGDRLLHVLDRRAFRTFARRAAGEWVTYHCDAPMLVALVTALSLWTMVRRLAGRTAVRREPGRRPRVLHVIGSLGRGGAQVQLAELVNRTPPDGYEVDLLVLDRSDGLASRSLIRRPDVAITFVGPTAGRTSCVRRIAAHCRSRRYDVVHTWMLGANVLGSAGARLAGVPRVITSVRALRKGYEWWYREWWWRLLDALTSRAADVVTVNASALVDDHARWARLSRARIAVVHNGLDPAALAADRDAARARLLDLAGWTSAAVVVGTVGRLSGEKDHETFLEMIARVRASRPDIRAVLVGDGQLRAALERRADALGISEAVAFLGERDDARTLMAGFDLFVLTSITEGFPNVLLEAAFAGVPCLATDVAGNPEVVGSDALLFPPADVAACASRVIAALSDPPRMAHEAVRLHARAHELFTAERSVAAWLRLYDQCLAGSAAAVELQPVGALGGR